MPPSTPSTPMVFTDCAERPHCRRSSQKLVRRSTRHGGHHPPTSATLRRWRSIDGEVSSRPPRPFSPGEREVVAEATRRRRRVPQRGTALTSSDTTNRTSSPTATAQSLDPPNGVTVSYTHLTLP